MATKSNYITEGTLRTNNNIILGLLAERDTKIANLNTRIDDLSTGLHYVGDVTTLPTNPDDGALYYFINVVKDTETLTGWYFYIKDTDKWENIGGGSDKSAVHYKGTATSVPTNPSNGDMYDFNVPATETTSAMVGIYIWSEDSASWEELVGVETTPIDFSTDPWS